ncbi:MAG: cbb3-type cytochrome c oxidase subunit I, partial [Rhodospirillales bacterium]|nr:cbb3-type cytochrome c oxidase subunit I [Rhodospirillales bacterium]
MSQTVTATRALSYLEDGKTLRSWLLTTDHKRIAILYALSITVFFFIGGSAAALIRYNLITPEGALRSAETYNRLFTMHGVIMVWFFLVPAAPVTIGNFIIPLMIGARDLAFPKINLMSWYLFMAGGACALYALFAGGVDTGWTFYAPLSSNYAQGHVVAVVAGIFISGFSTIATGLNFVVTIHRLRAPGLTWYRLPVFIWSFYATSVIFLLATPVLAQSGERRANRPGEIPEQVREIHNLKYSVHNSRNADAMVVLPKDIDVSKPVNVTIYNHGWYDTARSAVGNARLTEQMRSAPPNTVLVVPEWQVKPGTYGPKANFQGRYTAANFAQEQLQEIFNRTPELKATKLGDIQNINIISHSAGINPTESTLYRNPKMAQKINSVTLLDSLYDRSGLNKWIKANIRD